MVYYKYIYWRVILWKSTTSVFPWSVIPRSIRLVTAVPCCAFDSLLKSNVSLAGNLNNRACRSGTYTAHSLIICVVDSSSVLQAGHRVSTTFLMFPSTLHYIITGGQWIPFKPHFQCTISTPAILPNIITFGKYTQNIICFLLGPNSYNFV